MTYIQYNKLFYNLNLLCIYMVFLLLFEYNNSISHTKVRIKPKNLLKLPQTFDYYAFISWFLLNKSVLLQSRVVVAYECLFSDLRYICNTCTQVANRYIMLILKRWNKIAEWLLFYIGKFKKKSVRLFFRAICRINFLVMKM